MYLYISKPYGTESLTSAIVIIIIINNIICGVKGKEAGMVSHSRRSQTSRLPLVPRPPMRTAFGTEWGQSALDVNA